MSRIGKLPISIPAGVTVNFDANSNVVTVKGPKGELSQKIDPSIKFIPHFQPVYKAVHQKCSL